MSDVFISHVEEDGAIALEIARGLNAAGYATWCYEKDNNPGLSYLTQIGEAIEACQAVLILISPESLGSDQVTREIEYSHEVRKRFVPVLKGISHVEFQNRRASWRVALGTASSIPIPPEGISAILPRIVLGLQGLGVKPGGAKAHSERKTKVPPVAGAVRENPQDGLKYVWIPPGRFQMGCSPGDSECRDDERPGHQVTLTKGFWLGRTEVTVGAYKWFALATRKRMPKAPDFNPNWGNEQMPIVNVSWDEAQAYCAWAAGRLPTEAEWEYAARAGSTEARYGLLNIVAWHDENSGSKTHPVGEKRANGFGLYDMLGNVWEWVNDWYDENYYQHSPGEDPTGPKSGTRRVLRGGSWGDFPRLVRVSYRYGYYPAYGGPNCGFRCAREVDMA